MKSIFLCFANDEKESLKSLKREREELLKLLDKGHSKSHFILKEIPNATRDKVIDGLIQYRKNLSVFLFSGHAGRDKLLFEDGLARAEGIIGLLDKCPKLELVILNGCSTANQAKQLIELSSKPIVIATSASVEDHSATDFSIRFFKTLIEQKATFQNAFETAISSLKVKLDNDEIIKRYRELLERDEEQSIWGMFCRNNRKKSSKWKTIKKNKNRIKTTIHGDVKKAITAHKVTLNQNKK